MKIIIGYEFSAVVRSAFEKKGHEVISVDLLPSLVPGNHYTGDIWEFLSKNNNFDLGIFHPPCTFVCSSGIHRNKNNIERQQKTQSAIQEFKKILQLPIEKICIENPVGVLSTSVRKPDQIIQPWQYGHPESKTTCLWLKNLPLLQPTKIADFAEYRCRCKYVFPAEYGKYGCPNCGGEYAAKPKWNNQTKSGQSNLPPGPNRWKLRSITYTGIAEAMASQWS